MAELVVIGLNHRTAPVQVRERLALPGDLVPRILAAMHADPVLEESLILATCNRTELYCVPRPGHDPLEYFLAMVGRARGAAVEADRSVFYRQAGLDAARHLFRVAASLDSQIIGEHQILGQVREAYRLAVQARTAGFLLNKLLHWAFRAGKRVRTETDLDRGSVGIAPAAVELAGQIFESLHGKAVLLVGAGRTAECAARALLRGGAARLIVANRTLGRARQLACDLVRAPPAPGEDACEDEGGEGPPVAPVGPAPPATDAEQAQHAEAPGAPEACAPAACAPDGGAPAPGQDAAATPATEAVGLEDIPRVLERVDLVISSTGSPEVVLTYAGLADGLKRRRRPVFIVDIAVPRDVEERLGGLDNVFLYNIDDLNQLVARNLERRRQEIPRAEAIVEDELAAYGQWLASRQAAPTIRLLYEFLESLQQAHVSRYGKQFTEADRERLKQFAQTLGNQFLHRPTALLRALAEEGTTSESLEAADLVRRLFGLDETKHE
ncbi:MAG: glutamyl-tRNA reductase [Planctomycetes bacterium]|nr:glutamyl-tRNA reductase [Planctomycetota bacterium]